MAVTKKNLMKPAFVSLPPSHDLAYLTGVISGDGSISRTSRTFKLAIACDLRYPDLIEKYMALVARVTGRQPHILPRGNWVEVRVYGCELPTILGLPSGAKSRSGYTVPEWIFDNREYSRKFLLGLIETDGGFYQEFRNSGWSHRCLFTAYNETIMQAFLRAAALLGYAFRRCGNQARLTIGAEVRRLAQELDCRKVRVYNYG